MYINVILPLYLPQMFTYSVPQELQSQIVIGMRVSVTIGRNKIYSAIVYNITNDAPSDNLTYRQINNIIDSEPIITETQLRLWEWISNYYMCSLGEVMKCFIPKELRLTASIDSKNKIEYKKSSSVIKIKYINVLEKEFDVVIPKIIKSKKQKEAYNTIMELSKNGTNKVLYDKSLSEIITANILKELSNKNIIKIEICEQVLKYIKECKEIGVFQNLPMLTNKQKEAYNKIKSLFDNNRPTLLFGVSGSGKTEIYLNIIKDVIESGKSALILIPEIALTTHLTNRIYDYFGDIVTVYTSIQTDAQRYKAYYRILNSDAKIVIGTRISIGLPFENLGVIVVDEEHDNSYKQSEPPPRFNARDTAVVLGNISSASVLLVSSTPSIESYHNAKNNKYNLVKIDETFVEKNRGKITVIDKRDIANKEKITDINATENRYFSKYLLSKIEENVSNKNQTIIFKNNRGFANYIECRNCGHTPKCQNCNITLNYHNKSNKMVCHICSESIQKSNICQLCGSNDLVMKGYGTENIEDRIIENIQNSSVIRIDNDTIKSKKNIEEALEKIEKKDVNIIVGTQIICKGFDFSNVSLVAIVDADSLLNQANFRAEERAFQTFIQLFGRTTRTFKKGEMIIQTSNPNSKIIADIREMDYNNMYIREIKARKEFSYPPFTRLLSIIIKHKDKDSLKIASEILSENISKITDKDMVSVNIPFVDKVRGLFITKIVIKLPADSRITNIKTEIRIIIDNFLKNPIFKGYSIGIDVDSQS